MTCSCSVRRSTATARRASIHRPRARSTAAGPRRSTETTPSCPRNCARSWAPNDSFRLGRSGDLDYGVNKGVEQDTDMFSLTTGIKGTTAGDWRYDAYYQYGRTRSDITLYDALRLDRVYRAIDAVTRGGWPHRMPLHPLLPRRWLRAAESLRRRLTVAGRRSTTSRRIASIRFRSFSSTSSTRRCRASRGRRGPGR